MELVAQASTGPETIEQFRLHQPDVTLMDLQMPGMSGIEAMIGIRSEFPNARIIVLTTYAGDIQATRALKAGARAYLLKARLLGELWKPSARYMPVKSESPRRSPPTWAEHVRRKWPDRARDGGSRLIAAGNANKEIGAQLSITEETVKSRVSNILSKLGANDRTHAVMIGLKRGIIEL